MRTKKKTKTHNRILALALSLCLMLGLVPTGFIPTGLLPAGVETDFKIEAQAAEAPDPTAIYNSSWQAPYEKYGELQLKIDPADGIKKLHAAEDKGGQPVQLKGMSTFGMMFDNNGNSNEFKAEGAWILTPEVFDIMAYDWQVDFIRIAMYVTEGGTGVYAQLYNTLNGVTGGYPITGTYEPKGRPDIALRRVIKAMDLAIERGLYVMVDWHVLNPGDPSNPDYLNAATWMTGDASATFEYPDEKTVGVDWTSTGDGLEGVSPGIDISDFPTWRRNQTAPSKRTMNGPQLFFSYLANRYYAATGSITTNSSGVITGNNRQTTPRDAEATQLRGSQALKGQGQIIWEIANEPNTRDWNIEQHSRAAAQGGCNHPNTIRNGASITFGHSMNYGWQNIQACNWEYRLLPYMNGVTSTIRYFDQNGIIIAGTDNWCQYVDAPVMANKFVTDIRNTKTGITDPRDEDYRVMYTMHFYAGTHDVGDVYDSRNGRLSYPDADGNNGYGTSYNDYAALGPAPAGTTGAYWLRQKIDNALAGGMAIFCTEWGVSGASGDFGPYLEFSERWLDYLAKKGISWSAWSLARKNETSSVTKFNTPNGTGTSPFPNAFTGANAQRRDESLGGATYGIPYWTDVQVSDAGRYIRAKLRGESDALAKTRSGDIRFKKADTEKGSFVSLPFTFDNGKGREGWSSEGNLLESSDMTIANVAPAGQPENMALKVSLDMTGAGDGNDFLGVRDNWDYGAWRFTSSTGGFLGGAMPAGYEPPTYGETAYVYLDIYVERGYNPQTNPEIPPTLNTSTLQIQVMPCPDGYGYWYQPWGDGISLTITTTGTTPTESIVTEDGRTLYKFWVCAPIGNHLAYRQGVPNDATIRNVTIVPVQAGFIGNLYIDNVGFIPKGDTATIAAEYVKTFQTVVGSGNYRNTAPYGSAVTSSITEGSKPAIFRNPVTNANIVDQSYGYYIVGPGYPGMDYDKVDAANAEHNALFSRALAATKEVLLTPAPLAAPAGANEKQEEEAKKQKEAYDRKVAAALAFVESLGITGAGTTASPYKFESIESSLGYTGPTDGYGAFMEAVTELLDATGDSAVINIIDQSDIVIYGQRVGSGEVANNLYVNLTKETFVANGFDVKAYSTDGGKKWTAINMNSKNHNLSPAKFPSRLPSGNKTLQLQVTDSYDTRTKQPAAGAQVVSFGTINGRPSAPPQVVVYWSNGNSNSATWGLNNKNPDPTNPFSGSQVEVLKPANGKSIAAADSWQPYSNRTLLGLNKNGKTQSETYYIRTKPVRDGNNVYRAASKPKKVTVKSLQAPTKYKINYSTETIALKNGDAYRIQTGTTQAGADKGKPYFGSQFIAIDANTDREALALEIRRAISNQLAIEVRRNASGGTTAPTSVQTINPMGRATVVASTLAVSGGKITSSLKTFEISDLTKAKIKANEANAIVNKVIKWSGKVPAIKATQAGVYEFAIRAKQTSRYAKSSPVWLQITWDEYAAGKWGIVGAKIVVDINQEFLRIIEAMQQVITNDEVFIVYPKEEDEIVVTPPEEPDVPDVPDVPDGEVPDVPDTDVPDGDGPDGDAPDTDAPDGDVPDGDAPDTDPDEPAGDADPVATPDPAALPEEEE